MKSMTVRKVHDGEIAMDAGAVMGPEIAFAEAELPKIPERACRICTKPKTISMYSPSEWKRVGKPCCRECLRGENRKYHMVGRGRVDQGFQFGRRNIHGALTERPEQS